MVTFKHSKRMKKEAMVSGELEWADITNTFLKCQEKPK